MAGDPWGAISSPVGNGAADWDSVGAPVAPATPPAPRQAPPVAIGTPTGQVHDGDTFRLTSGMNGRLLGVDAYELNQPGYDRNGNPVHIGITARDLLRSNISPASTVTPNGTATYGRPVASVTTNGKDVGGLLLDQGYALATPQYLQSDPARRADYMERERLARMNRFGAFKLQAQTPWDWRHGVAPSWQQPEVSKDGRGTVVFNDEAMPSSGLRPEIEKQYLDLFKAKDTTVNDLVAFGQAHDFIVDPKDAAARLKKKNTGVQVSEDLLYSRAPRILHDSGDAALGAGLRGVADPLNVLDELGAVVDTAGLTGGREDIWNSDRRWADVYDNNLEQNRGILGYDELHHPAARIGGQIAGSLVLPVVGTEGVYANAARAALRAGAGRFAAEQAGRAAVRNRLIAIGAGEGFVAGGGAGEGGPMQRLPSALGGAVVGGGIGAAGGLLAPVLGRGVASTRGLVRGRLATRDAADFAPIAPLPPDAVPAPRPLDRLTPSPPARARDETVPEDLEGGSPEASVAPVAREDPLVTGSIPLQPRQVPENSFRAPLSDFSPVVWREMSFDGDRFGRLTMPSEHAGRWGGDTDHLMFADDPALATGQGANKGILFEYDAHPFLGSPQFSKPMSRFAFERGSGEYLTSGVTQDKLQAALRGFKIKPDYVDTLKSSEQAVLSRILGDLRAKGWRETQVEDGSTVFRRPDASRAAMAAEDVTPTVTAPVSEWDSISTPAGQGAEVPASAWDAVGAPVAGATRPRDYLDVGSGAVPGGIGAERNIQPRARPFDAPASAAEIAGLARNAEPDAFVPRPNNEVSSLEEALQANPGTLRDVTAPNERDMLPSYRLTPGGPVRRDPIDLVGWLRTQGGLRDDGGELAHMGLDNAPRNIPFAKSEGFLGRLVHPRGLDDFAPGMSLDEAAHRAWEEGFFPGRAERPTVAEFLDAIRATHRGETGRVFHPEDYPHLEAYDQALAQRGRVETAQQEGSPLAEDVGQPVTLDDLDANQPPATAYEDLTRVGGKAGNIRIDSLNSTEDIGRALQATDARFGGFGAARRGKITHAETQALADEMGMTVDDLLKRRKGQALNAEQALAARQILARSGQDLVQLARKASGGSEEELANFQQALIRHAAIQEQVSGATAEAGRALSQFRATADAANNPRVHRLIQQQAVEGAGGRDKLEGTAQAILDLIENGAPPAKVNDFTRNAIKPRFRDKLVELYYNSLLSNPPTHVVNMLSNTLTAAGQLPEHAVAAAIGAARNAMSKQDVDRVLGSEVGQRLIGMVQGAKEGLAQFARTARTGDVPDFVTKVEARTDSAISGLKGKIIRTPTRLLAAEDELFKGVARRMEINGLAARKASLEGLKGDAFKERVAQLSQFPTDDMIDRSLDYARYVTFQQPLTGLPLAMSMATRDNLFLKMVVPFVRTPVNIFSFAVERSPFAPFVKRWRADIAAGGARRDLAASKMALGTGLGLMAIQWAADGRITGGMPRDKKQADLLKADGWQPYSIRVGDRYISYARLDPFATTLGAAADMADTAHAGGDLHEVGNRLLLSVMTQLDSKTFLSGLSDLAKVIDTTEKGDTVDRATNYAGRLASGFVPAIAGGIARSLDPYQRNARGFLPQIQAKVPYWSQSLPARTDVWGQPVPNIGSLGPDLVSPFRMGQRRNDPVNNAFLSAGAGVSVPRQEIAGVPLTDEQYRAYVQSSGGLIRGGLSAALADRTWLAKPEAERKKDMERLVRDARRRVRQGMFGSQR